MSSRDLAKFTDVRRYATLVCVIQEARATLTDEVIELHERILGTLFSQAKRTQAERLQLTGKLIQSKLKQYVTVGQALLHARESGEDPWAAIEDFCPGRSSSAVWKKLSFLSRKGNFDPLHLIIEKYSTLRKYARVCCQHCSSSRHLPRRHSAMRWTPSGKCTVNNFVKFRQQRQQDLSLKAGENWYSRLQESTASTTSFAY
ncbi:Transposase and inactivated derivatives, TnpA family [Kluyvera cryocrescens]|uniref:Transposase and inactivated derivatives, TnpA family n=1 Tax=Kluyvera cryocrescens TaxID=580 RepID=A0A485A822_KLUCR|nr:Transposase and inactivated derivatives, TnpA family [Kluyvera cryocrescens]